MVELFSWLALAMSHLWLIVLRNPFKQSMPALQYWVVFVPAVGNRTLIDSTTLFRQLVLTLCLLSPQGLHSPSVEIHHS